MQYRKVSYGFCTFIERYFFSFANCFFRLKRSNSSIRFVISSFTLSIFSARQALTPAKAYPADRFL